MISLYFDPHGKKIFTFSSNTRDQQEYYANQLKRKKTADNIPTDASDMLGSDDSNIASLKAKIKQLECQLKEIKPEVC